MTTNDIVKFIKSSNGSLNSTLVSEGQTSALVIDGRNLLKSKEQGKSIFLYFQHLFPQEVRSSKRVRMGRDYKRSLFVWREQYVAK
jgi:hypothetical protein